MTDRLYYHDSFLYDFDATVHSVLETPRPAVILDRTAFYPTSGGQIHDTGHLSLAQDDRKFRVTEVVDTEDGHIVHYLDAPLKNIQPGTSVHGAVDAARRRDHMQQHSAQHVLSAAFIRLFNFPTVSFHMADDYCSIDLNTPTLSREQVEQAEGLANQVILENRAVEVRYASRDEAATLGLRKKPATDREKLRLIDIHHFDLSACGGTHVAQTGQIGAVLLRKFEKVRQGYRVELVAGLRAVSTARRDFSALTEAAALFSAHIYDVPQQARKALDENRALSKQREQSQKDLANAEAATLLASPQSSAPSAADGVRVIVHTFQDRDLNFVKLVAQKLTREQPSVITLLATRSPLPSLVFAQSQGQPYDMSALLKEVMARLGGRGGGTKDLAQGGAPTGEGLPEALSAAAQKLSQNV